MSTASEIYKCPNGRTVIDDGLNFMENSEPGETEIIRCPNCPLRVRFRTPYNAFTPGVIEGQLQYGGGEPDEDYVWVIGDCERNSP